MALDLAKVDEGVKSGRLTERQGVGARVRIRKAAASAKFSREQQADEAVIGANERGLRDMLGVRSQLAGRRDALKRQIGAGSAAERDALNADKAVEALKEEREHIFSQGGDVEIKKRNIADITTRIGLTRRFSSESLAPKRAELGAIEKELTGLDTSIQERRSGVLQSNTEVAQRMATRQTVFGINQQTADVGSGLAGASERGGAAAAGASNRSLQAFLGSAQAMVSYAETATVTQARVEGRLRALENQVRNASNR
jgi:hypothetical protein